MQPDIIFRSATIPASQGVRIVDIAVSHGLIERIEPSIGRRGSIEVNCEGLTLLPGAIDMHVHLREPGATHKEDIRSGTSAAVAGGVTTVIEMPNTSPPTTTVEELDRKVAIAKEASLCNISFYMALTDNNLAEIERAIGHPGFAGVKVYLGSTTGDILLKDMSVLDRAVSSLPTLFVFHAELERFITRSEWGIPDASLHHVIRPEEAVVEGALLVAELASSPERRLHLCHVSSASELAVISDTKWLTCEVTPHHLYFTVNDTARMGNLLKVNPPLRYEKDLQALRAALANGRISAVASDHAPHTLDEKRRPYKDAPSGVPGLDTIVPSVLRLVQSGELTLFRAVEVLAANPARIVGLKNKGCIEEGADADIALYDLSASWTPTSDIRSRCGWTPFLHVPLGPRPLAVWIKGQRVI